jgi:predicted nucleic acid-binding protein
LIVVDTNVIAYALIEGDKTTLARDVASADPDWRVPQLWRHEFLNILATAARAEVINARQADKLWSTGLDLLSQVEQEMDGRAALALAIEYGISAYDAQYIALAHGLGTLCVTEDRRLLRTFSETAISMKAFCG